MSTQSPDEWLTVDEVAALLKVPRSTVYRWNTTGTGPPYVAVGKHRRYSLSAVKRWLAGRTVGAAGEAS